MTPVGDGGPPPSCGQVRFYGRRHGRSLRPRRLAALSLDLDRLVLALPADAGVRLDPRLAFDPPRPRVWLELGFGTGEHLLGQAARDPEVALIGCEAFLNGVAALTVAVTDAGLAARVRIFADDARRLLPRLAPASVERVFILFPDPWPKRRHRSRRLLNDATIDELAEVLIDGGELRFASDHDEYALSTLARLTRHPALRWTATRAADWRQPPADWIPTRYERKARAAARPPLFFRFVRRIRAENCERV